MHQFRTWSPADGQLQDWQVEVGAIHATIYSKPVKESKCEGENKNEENGMPTEAAENTRFEDVVFVLQQYVESKRQEIIEIRKE